MGLLNGETVVQGDFVTTSAGAGDSGKAPKLGSEGYLSETFFKRSFKFGGDGSDGALTITSGATNIDLGSAQVVIKNYSSISITGTGSLTFSNPHANGTVVILKSVGNVTLTSSTAPMINASALGAIGGTGVSVGASSQSDGSNGTDGKCFTFLPTTNKGTNDGATASAATIAYPSTYLSLLASKYPTAFVAAGGASGAAKAGTTSTATSSNGGRGGGTLFIECAGALNFTTASGISVAGGSPSAASFTGSNYNVFGSGGGAGGFFCMRYNSLTSASGTVTTSGGTGNTGFAAGSTPTGTRYSGGSGANYQAGNAGSFSPGASGANGPAGLSIIEKNTEFS